MSGLLDNYIILKIFITRDGKKRIKREGEIAKREGNGREGKEGGQKNGNRRWDNGNGKRGRERAEK